MRLMEELKRRNVFRVAGVYGVVGWLLAQAAGVLENALNMPGWFDTVVVSLLLIFFPVAILLAWAFEVTPDGVKLTAKVAEREGVGAKSGKTLDYVIIGGLALVCILIISNRFTSQSPAQENKPVVVETASAIKLNAAKTPNAELAPERGKSIAVLPFANRSPNADDAFFSEGVHDDLLTHLSKIADMHVISRTSVMRYAGTQEAIPDIARALGVSSVMEGAVQRAGNRVRINVQLIDGVTDQHIWAEIYDRELTADNIFDIQSEITQAIAAALKTVLSPEDKANLAERPTRSLAAYDAYLRGVSVRRMGSPAISDYEKSIAEFTKAIGEDPGFAAAYAQRAISTMAIFWDNSMTGKALLESARRDIDRANALAPQDVETLTAEGYYYYLGFLNYSRALEFINRALAAAPNYVDVLMLKGYVSRRAGDFGGAFAALEKANSLDPLSASSNLDLAYTYTVFGRFDDAARMIERARAVEPESERALAYEAQLWLRQGDFDRTCKTYEDAKPGPDWFNYYFAGVYCAALRHDARAVDHALAAIPEDLRSDAAYPEAFDLLTALALDRTGRENEARRLALEVAKRIAASDNPYPTRWSNNAPYWPVTIPGLLRDLEAVRAAAKDFEENADADALSDLELWDVIGIAFLRAGDPETAFDYFDRITRVAGPSHYLAKTIDQEFDGVRNHPRYLKLKADFDKWAVQTGYKAPAR